LTKGTGCIDEIEPCSKYQGTQDTCKNFVGSSNTKKCWNTSGSSITTTSFCVDRKCTDDVESQTDINCNQFLGGCVTKGIGCLDISAPCGSYTGTSATCLNYKGSNESKTCWSLNTTEGACIEK
jgi:hypothetical protein